MKRRTPHLLLAGALLALGGGEDSEPLGPEAPRVFLLDAKSLLDARARLARGEVGLQPALLQLRKDAERALALKPGSVMDKPLIAESGDKHDYFSYCPHYNLKFPTLSRVSESPSSA